MPFNQEVKKTKKSTISSQIVIQILDNNAAIAAIADGKISDKVKTRTPSRTPSPAGAKTATNPIKPAIAKAPVVNK